MLTSEFWDPKTPMLLAQSRSKDIPDSTSESDVYYWEFITYVIMGILLVSANTPILVNILRHSVLRAKKEYLLFAGKLQ